MPMAKKSSKDYPYNLLDEIFKNEPYVIPDDFEDVLRVVVLRRGSEHKYSLLMKYYKEHKTFEEIAEEMKCTTWRTRDKLMHTINRLCEPLAKRQLQGGVEKTIRKRGEDAEGKRNDRIRAKQDDKCAVCSWSEDTLDVHHILPLSKGGADEEYNLIALCPNCHRLAHKGKLTKNDFALRINKASV